MDSASALRLIFRLAVQNVRGRPRKSLVIGLVLFGDALLLVLGLSFVGSLDSALERNVTSTFAGQIQIYSGSAPEEMQLFGGSQGIPDIGVIPDFAAVKNALASVANVRATVPQGSGPGYVYLGNRVERSLLELRGALAGQDGLDVAALAARTRDLVEQITAEDAVAASEGLDVSEDPERLRADLVRAKSAELWERFHAAPYEVLEFLDNRIARLAGDPRTVAFRYLGTDLPQFTSAFDRFEIVKGQSIPAGDRGVLLDDLVHETAFKNPMARGLDQLVDDVLVNKMPLSREVFEARVRDLLDRRQSLVRGLGAQARAELESAFRRVLPGATGDLSELEGKFLELTPENLAERHRLFNDSIAPRLNLYDINIGDTIVVHAVSRAGLPTAAKVKVWGTYRFAGLAGFAAVTKFNIVDLSTFRTLLNEATAEARQEMDSLRAEMRGLQIDPDVMDDSLFSRPRDALTQEENRPGRAPLVGLAPALPQVGARLEGAIGSPQGLEHGPVGHAAVILRDTTRLADTQRELRAISDSQRLNLRIVDWRTAAGLVAGHFDLLRAQFYIALGIIFLVALVIINTAIVVAVLDRVRELGTLRALGAGRALVVATLMCESALLGAVAGGIGVGVGLSVIRYAHATGIPATGPVWTFLFGGPRLYPTTTVAQLVVAFCVVLFISLVATIYPARLATRVQPSEALRQGG